MRPMRTAARPLRTLLTAFCIACLAAMAGRLCAAEPLNRFPVSVLRIQAHGGGEWFNVWIANTAERQEQGLMYQKWVPADWGMLFPESAPRVKSMWMKNTLIPLDMLFIESSGRIAYIRENAVPESLDIITFAQPVAAVLELNGGTCARTGIRVGDHVRHALFGTSAGAPSIGR